MKQKTLANVAIKNSLQLAVEKENSICCFFSAISTGNYGYPIERADTLLL